MPEIRSTKVQCRTMGHESCTRWSEQQPNGFWKTWKIVHTVYGKQITEMFQD